MAHGDGKEGYGCYRVTGLVSTGAQLVPCGLWGHISYRMAHTYQVAGESGPASDPSDPQGQAAMAPTPHRTSCQAKAIFSSRLAASPEHWMRKGATNRYALRLPIPSSICLSQPALCPKLPPCKTENNIFLLQLHLLCFSKTGFNQR